VNLADWFPDEDHRFQMRFERGPIADYFKPLEADQKILGERHGWLRSAPKVYADLLPEGGPLLEETIEIAQVEQALSSEALATLSAPVAPLEKCIRLGESWEPDFILLHRDGNGAYCVAGGCLCFPSSWSLQEKIGHPMEFVHGPVPGLNAELGQQINAFLSKMKPGLAWQRMNWGLSVSSELNHHPARNVPPLQNSTNPKSVYLRLEHQALIKLPRTQGVLFAIRVTNVPLAELKNNPAVAKGLAHALRTMSQAVATYKRIVDFRETAAHFLEH
jgi:hypothetical protein